MDARTVANELRKLANVLDPPPLSTVVPEPSARDRAAGLLREFADSQAYQRSAGVERPMSPELQAYVARNPPELRALQGGHPNPMSEFRESDHE